MILLRLMVFSNKSRNKEKFSPFECGFDPTGTPRMNFCMKFFLVAVIFLVFDVEVSLILPLPFRQTYLLLLIIVLTIGLAYEWYFGGLEWLYVNRSCIRCFGSDLFWILTNHLIDDRSKPYIVFTPNFQKMIIEKDLNALFHRTKSRLVSNIMRRYRGRPNIFHKNMIVIRITFENESCSFSLLRGGCGCQIGEINSAYLSNVTKDHTYEVTDFRIEIAGFSITKYPGREN